MTKGMRTRQRILDVAEQAVLAKGFGGTSIDEIIVNAGITKSGFLYHFKDKSALALALLDRYVEADNQILDDVFNKARALTDDPLQCLLVGLKLVAEVFYDMPNGHPGCMVAAVCYNERVFDREIYETNREAVLSWRGRFLEAMNEIAAIYPPNDDVDLEALADMFTVVTDGGIILSKVVGEPRALGDQILLLRSYIKLLFSPIRAS